jgi:predicted dehydrogenase
MAADAVEDRARQTAELLGFEGWTTDWRQAVEHPGVEA